MILAFDLGLIQASRMVSYLFQKVETPQYRLECGNIDIGLVLNSGLSSGRSTAPGEWRVRYRMFGFVLGETRSTLIIRLVAFSGRAINLCRNQKRACSLTSRLFLGRSLWHSIQRDSNSTALSAVDFTGVVLSTRRGSDIGGD